MFTWKKSTWADLIDRYARAISVGYIHVSVQFYPCEIPRRASDVLQEQIEVKIMTNVIITTGWAS